MTDRPDRLVATPPTVWSRPTPRDLFAVICDDLRSYSGFSERWRQPGFRALAVYRLGTYRRTLPTSFPWGWIRRSLALVTGALERRVRIRYGIQLPSTATVGRGVRIVHQNGIVIHHRAVIGDRCVIRTGVVIGQVESHLNVPVIGADVSLGVGAKVVGRCVVSDRASVGPNAVITRDVSVGALAVAPPARVIYLPGGTTAAAGHDERRSDGEWTKDTP